MNKRSFIITRLSRLKNRKKGGFSAYRKNELNCRARKLFYKEVIFSENYSGFTRHFRQWH